MTANEKYLSLVGKPSPMPLDARRIDSACWLDGNDDEFIIEFWSLPGSIYRTCYNRRTTCTDTQFVPVNSWEYDELRKMADALHYQI